MDYMTEIAAAVLPALSGEKALRPDSPRRTRGRKQAANAPGYARISQELTGEVEAALKAELGWSRFLDIWRDGTSEARCGLLVDLLYRRPDIALMLVRKLRGNQFPELLNQIARRIRTCGPDSAVGLYRSIPDDKLLATLMVSPERVLMLAEFFAIPVPISTAEHVLWAAAQNAGESDTARLHYLMTRLARLKQELELIGQTVEHSTDAAMLSQRAGYRNAVDREVERTEASIRRLEQLLAGMRGNTPKPPRQERRRFIVGCRRRRSERRTG
jgi:hypothetical protein